MLIERYVDGSDDDTKRGTTRQKSSAAAVGQWEKGGWERWLKFAKPSNSNLCNLTPFPASRSCGIGLAATANMRINIVHWGSRITSLYLNNSYDV